MDNPIPSKRCTKCGIEYPATPEYFHRSKNGKYGVMAKCKKCAHAYYRAHKNEHLEYQREWRLNNPERARERNRRYKISHREIERQRGQEYRRRHPDKKRLYYATPHGRNVVLTSCQKRRAAKALAAGSFTVTDIERKLKTQRHKCYYCNNDLPNNYHIDHVVPLSRGNSNAPENIVLTCPICNLSKNDKLPHEWPEGGRLL